MAATFTPWHSAATPPGVEEAEGKVKDLHKGKSAIKRGEMP
jgi:hypothetical protein